MWAQRFFKEKSDENVIKVNKNELQLALEKVQVFIKDKKERKNVAEFILSENDLKISGSGDYGSTSSNIFVSNENTVELKMYDGEEYKSIIPPPPEPKRHNKEPIIVENS